MRPSGRCRRWEGRLRLRPEALAWISYRRSCRWPSPCGSSGGWQRSARRRRRPGLTPRLWPRGARLVLVLMSAASLCIFTSGRSTAQTTTLPTLVTTTSLGATTTSSVSTTLPPTTTSSSTTSTTSCPSRGPSDDVPCRTLHELVGLRVEAETGWVVLGAALGWLMATTSRRGGGR